MKAGYKVQSDGAEHGPEFSLYNNNVNKKSTSFNKEETIIESDSCKYWCILNGKSHYSAAAPTAASYRQDSVRGPTAQIRLADER
ncbi:uncharacterized [Tachysurus ichikawai]